MFLLLKLLGIFEFSWGFIVLPWAWFFGAICREVEIENYLGRKLVVPVLLSGALALAGCHRPVEKVIVEKPDHKAVIKVGESNEAEPLGKRIFLRHIRARVASRLQQDGYAQIGKDATPLTKDQTDKLLAQLEDESILRGANETGASPEGGILAALEKLFEWIETHEPQIQALIAWIMSLIVLF